MALSSTLGLGIACKSYGGRVCEIISWGLLINEFKLRLELIATFFSLTFSLFLQKTRWLFSYFLFLRCCFDYQMFVIFFFGIRPALGFFYMLRDYFYFIFAFVSFLVLSVDLEYNCMFLL